MSEYIDYISWKTEEAIALVNAQGPNKENVTALKDHWVILSEGNVLTVPHGFGCVMFMACASSGFVFWAWFKAWQARRDYEVPQLYHHSNKFHIFNCLYRAYKSTHELHQRFLFYLVFSGLEMPLISSTAAFIWLLGRYFYVQGYITGNPENRGLGGCISCIGFQIVHLGAIRYGLRRLFW